LQGRLSQRDAVPSLGPSSIQEPTMTPVHNELPESDLEQVQAGKGGNSNGGTTPLTRMRARFLDEISIHLVDA
jgi:hypothetical protein